MCSFTRVQSDWLVLYVVRVEITGRDILDIFDSLEEDGYTVFRDKSKLSLSYVPAELVARRREEEYLARILVSGVRDNYLPPMIRVSGPPGSGKTVIVKSVLERFADRTDGFRFFYVNLKGSRTVFMAANAVLSSISGRRVASNLGLDRVFGEIWREIEGLCIGELFLCLVFDEVESVFLDKHYDPSDFFYRFIRHENYLPDRIHLCLIVISNDLVAVEMNLDARVLSSMGSEAITFSPYSLEELGSILENRMKEAFKPDAFDDIDAQYLTKFLDQDFGDARKAIDFLKICGEIANRKKTRIDFEVCLEALNKLEYEQDVDILRNLLDPQVNILACIAQLSINKGFITTGDLYQYYKKRDSRPIGKPISPLSERSVLDAVKYFESLGIIKTWNVSKGRRGYGKEIKMNKDPESILDAIRSKYGVRVKQ